MTRDVPMSDRMHAWRPVVGLCAYLAAAIAGGALVAFPAYTALSRVADPAFDSVLHRVAAVTLLVMLPLYLASGRRAPARAREARPLRTLMTRETFGFGSSAPAFRRGLVRGFALGVLVVSPLIAAFLMLGVRAPAEVATSPADIAAFAAYALIAALAIGLIEESYFRGALLAPLRELPPALSVSIVSVVYAAVHFIGAPLPGDDLGWSSGFASIARSEIPLDAFLALFAAGLFLGALRIRFEHIGVSAGFHAGWVWLMKLNQAYTDVVPDSAWRMLEGSYGGTMGTLGLVWIALLGIGWYAIDRARARGKSRDELAKTRMAR